MDILDPEFNPKFKILRASGPFPNNLLLGFELEVLIKNKQINHNEGFSESIKLGNKYKHLSKIFYAKEDGSVLGNIDYGLEINSHPFNWNWFLSKKKYFYDLGKFFKETRSYCNYTCGFHVHINKSFFKTKSHLYRFLYMFYTEPKIIKNISKRKRQSHLDTYAKIEILTSPSTEDGSMPWGYEFKKYKNNESNVPLKDITVHFNNNDFKNAKHIAVNLFHEKTVEIRIFQSTTNPSLFTSYLEFCMAMAIYTENENNSLKMKDFMSYVKNNINMYPNIKETNLLWFNKRKTSFRSYFTDIKNNDFWTKAKSIRSMLKRDIKRVKNTKKYQLTSN